MQCSVCGHRSKGWELPRIRSRPRASEASVYRRDTAGSVRNPTTSSNGTERNGPSAIIRTTDQQSSAPKLEGASDERPDPCPTTIDFGKSVPPSAGRNRDETLLARDQANRLTLELRPFRVGPVTESASDLVKPVDKDPSPKAESDESPGGQPSGDKHRSGIDRRAGADRRATPDRQKVDIGPPGGPDHERRTGIDRRLPGDRRSGVDRGKP